MTYSEALKKADKVLAEAGIKEHDIDSALLLSFVTKKDKTFLLAHGDETGLSHDEEARYKEAIAKRQGRIPLQIITGETDFMGLNFHVSENVLIPRIDTEFVVEEAMRHINDGAEVLDMCTGSGCILLSLMKYKNDIRGVGADISKDALALAKKNADALGIGNAEFIESDLFSNVEGRFDFIICNPPYIRSSDIEGLEEEVKCHEPLSALDGGDDGLDFYKKIIREAKGYLYGGARLMFEIGYDQGDAVSSLMEGAGYKGIQVLKDYSGNERVATCLKS